MYSKMLNFIGTPMRRLKELLFILAVIGGFSLQATADPETSFGRQNADRAIQILQSTEFKAIKLPSEYSSYVNFVAHQLKSDTPVCGRVQKTTLRNFN